MSEDPKVKKPAPKKDGKPEAAPEKGSAPKPAAIE